MKTKTYTQDFENRYNKRFVQSLLYSLSNVRSNVLMLCGPALEYHLIDAKKIFHPTCTKSKCVIYEIDNTMYLQNMRDLKNINYPYEVEIHNDNIVNAKIQRFVDFDACATLDTLLPTINILYNKMKKLHVNTKYKNIIVTCTLRRNNKKESIEKLCKLFGIYNSFNKTDIKLTNNCRLYEIKTHSYIARYIPYRDGSPMLSFSFQWK